MEGPDRVSSEAFEIDRGEEGDRFKLGELQEAEAQLLGRVTYEGFAAAWPTIEDEVGFAEKMNSMPKYVYSTTVGSAGWENSTILSGDFAGSIGKAKEEVRLIERVVAHFIAIRSDGRSSAIFWIVKGMARIGNWRPDGQAERSISRREFRELSPARRAEQVFELSRFMSQVAQAGRRRRVG